MPTPTLGTEHQKNLRDQVKQAIEEKKIFRIEASLDAARIEASDERTIDVVFAAGAEYRQWWGREQLAISKEGCRLDRLNANYSAFLLNHDIDRQIGTVVSGADRGEDGCSEVAVLKIPAWRGDLSRCVDGIRGQISCGYRILKYEIDESNERDPLYTITEWEPFEISIVAYAADPRAMKRNNFFIPFEPIVNVKQNRRRQTEERI